MPSGIQYDGLYDAWVVRNVGNNDVTLANMRKDLIPPGKACKKRKSSLREDGFHFRPQTGGALGRPPNVLPSSRKHPKAGLDVTINITHFVDWSLRLKMSVNFWNGDAQVDSKLPLIGAPKRRLLELDNLRQTIICHTTEVVAVLLEFFVSHEGLEQKQQIAKLNGSGCLCHDLIPLRS
ncbi:hypothetical protein GCM10007315_14490 [Gemmobacter tilapiae]|uniref:Uncharacterized protein n=1 Tax=Neogemmobacter tilapiae TaxID=875041 RepID=A0A918TMQ8_9RHOB|nr:hypothetical protein GCM10007315_14490 [Gemmobacter tilapiae]